ASRRRHTRLVSDGVQTCALPISKSRDKVLRAIVNSVRIGRSAVGGGPFHAPLTGGTPSYPDAVYYCSQDLVTAFCARSDDGGLKIGRASCRASRCGVVHRRDKWR